MPVTVDKSANVPPGQVLVKIVPSGSTPAPKKLDTVPVGQKIVPNAVPLGNTRLNPLSLGEKSGPNEVPNFRLFNPALEADGEYKAAQAKYYKDSYMKSGNLEFKQESKSFWGGTTPAHYTYHAEGDETFGDVKQKLNLPDGVFKKYVDGAPGNKNLYYISKLAKDGVEIPAEVLDKATTSPPADVKKEQLVPGENNMRRFMTIPENGKPVPGENNMKRFMTIPENGKPVPGENNMKRFMTECNS